MGYKEYQDVLNARAETVNRKSKFMKEKLKKNFQLNIFILNKFIPYIFIKNLKINTV